MFLVMYTPHSLNLRAMHCGTDHIHRSRDKNLDSLHCTLARGVGSIREEVGRDNIQGVSCRGIGVGTEGPKEDASGSVQLLEKDRSRAHAAALEIEPIVVR